MRLGVVSQSAKNNGRFPGWCLSWFRYTVRKNRALSKADVEAKKSMESRFGDTM